MQIPSREACDQKNCNSYEQQTYRILQLWLSDLYGRFDERSSNLDRLRSSLEYMIGSILRNSKETNFHEFWCDGVDIIDHVATTEHFQCAGACIMSDKDANKMWLAPFEIKIEYRNKKEEWPSAAMVKIGHADSQHIFNRSLPCNKEHRLFALSHWIYGERPNSKVGWAISVELDPYPKSK